LLLRCLAKAPSDRPADAADLLRELLQTCTVGGQWTALDAAAWWATHEKVPTAAEQPTLVPT